jgi:hypothetical protein
MESFDRTLDGLKAKYRRSRGLLDEARAIADPTLREDKLVPAIAQAVGIPDQIINAATGRFREIDRNPEEVRRHLTGALPHFELLRRLRIQDFHRAGLTSRGGTRTIHGEVRMEARGADQFAAYGLDANDKPFLQKSEGGSVTLDPKLVIQRDGSFYDEATGRYHSLEELLSEFLEHVPTIIDWFRSIRTRY